MAIFTSVLAPRKLHLLLIGAIVVGWLSVYCGGSSSTSTPTPTPITEPTVTTEPMPTPEVTVTGTIETRPQATTSATQAAVTPTGRPPRTPVPTVTVETTQPDDTPTATPTPPATPTPMPPGTTQEAGGPPTQTPVPPAPEPTGTAPTSTPTPTSTSATPEPRPTLPEPTPPDITLEPTPDPTAVPTTEPEDGSPSSPTPTATTAPGAVITVGSGELAPGGTIEIPITAAAVSAPGAAAYTITIQFDGSVIQVNAILPGDATFGEPLTSNIGTDILKFSDLHVEDKGITGEFVLVILQISATGSSGSSDLSITIDSFKDVNAQDIATTSVNGTISIQ